VLAIVLDRFDGGQDDEPEHEISFGCGLPAAMRIRRAGRG
jgi:hypothetical protein